MERRGLASAGDFTTSGGYGLSGHDFGDFGGGGGGRASSQHGQAQWLTQYVRRLWSWDQMDFDSCFDQMVTLIGPPHQMSKIFKLANYRKKTKNQWARDDPAFALVQCGFLIASALAWGITCLNTRLSLGGFLLLVVKEVLGTWLLGGIIISSLLVHLSNTHLIEHSVHSVAQTVEWLYAFDIHCNAFFVSFLLTHVVQFLLLPVLLSDGLVPSIFANLLWSLSLAAYCFVTHLGYRALPFLKHTEYYLYPIAGIVLLFVLSVLFAVVGVRFNMTRSIMSSYFGGHYT